MSLEPLPAYGSTRPAQARSEPHDQHGQPKRERRAGCLDRAWPGTSPRASQQVADERELRHANTQAWRRSRPGRVSYRT
jgi:hypothetical protein